MVSKLNLYFFFSLCLSFFCSSYLYMRFLDQQKIIEIFYGFHNLSSKQEQLLFVSNRNTSTKCMFGHELSSVDDLS